MGMPKCRGQRAAGLINPRVYHSADSNKSEIVVVFDTEDTKMAKDFAASADLKEAMMKAGVLDTPTKIVTHDTGRRTVRSHSRVMP
jgi:hypothetical protein